MLFGCDSEIRQFHSNDLYALTLTKSRQANLEAAKEDVALVMDEWFGSPNEPRWPSDLLSDAGQDLVDIERLRRAAGPVSSLKDGTHLGLYREHCVNCHGLSGDGFGPASLAMNPYPRDFRHGVFKWKSTSRFEKPIRADIRRTIQKGAAGTAMPEFSVLADDDVRALVDYVIYLSIRGEVERKLMALSTELGYDTTPPEDALRITAGTQLGKEGTEGVSESRQVLTDVVNQWTKASSQVVDAPEFRAKPDPMSVERGRAIFHGPIANCVGCHGLNGSGDAVTLDYDDWTKEYSTRIGLTPTDRSAMKPFRKAGAPKPRPIIPRDLQSGVFRGGGDAETLYRRITQGIAGTPMPAVELVQTENGKGLTSDQVVDLVYYVQSLEHSLEPSQREAGGRKDVTR